MISPHLSRYIRLISTMAFGVFAPPRGHKPRTDDPTPNPGCMLAFILRRLAQALVVMLAVAFIASSIIGARASSASGLSDPPFSPIARMPRWSGKPAMATSTARGAVITGFKTIAANAFSLEYRLNERLFTLNYGFNGGAYTFEFVDPSGAKRTETYRRR